MFTHDRRTSHPQARRAAVAIASTTFLVLLGGLVDTAAADTPQGWATAPHVSGLDFLVVLLLIPLGLAAVISFLVVLPTLAGDHGYQPGHRWRGENEWFGGPRQGVAAIDELDPEQLEARSSDTGGTSGRW